MLLQSFHIHVDRFSQLLWSVVYTPHLIICSIFHQLVLRLLSLSLHGQVSIELSYPVWMSALGRRDVRGRVVKVPFEMELSSFSVPKSWRNYIFGAGLSSSSKKWVELQELSSLN